MTKIAVDQEPQERRAERLIEVVKEEYQSCRFR